MTITMVVIMTCMVKAVEVLKLCFWAIPIASKAPNEDIAILTKVLPKRIVIKSWRGLLNNLRILLALELLLFSNFFR